MHGLAGLDINGWRDWVARNWSAEDLDEILIDGVCIDGGYGLLLDDSSCERQAQREEILRLGNGSWRKVAITGAARDRVLPFSLPDKLRAYFEGVACVLATSPLAMALTNEFRASLTEIMPAPLHHLAKCAVADGALEAARRISRGIPHYLDKLDPIAMALLEGREAVFKQLFDEDAVVAANREYVSEPRTALWSAQSRQLEFFIRRGDEGIRKWITDEIDPPRTNQKVEIRVYQKPAQGLARVEVRSTDWDVLRRRPIRLDWDRLKEEYRSEPEILRELTRPLPGVPERLVYGAHPELWLGGDTVSVGLADIVKEFEFSSLQARERLYQALRRPLKPLRESDKYYAFSTDGGAPAQIDARVIERRFRKWVEWPSVR